MTGAETFAKFCYGNPVVLTFVCLLMQTGISQVVFHGIFIKDIMKIDTEVTKLIMLLHSKTSQTLFNAIVNPENCQKEPAQCSVSQENLKNRTLFSQQIRLCFSKHECCVRYNLGNCVINIL